MSLATLIGTEKPTPEDCRAPPSVTIRVLIPITWPRVLSRGPPELPGLMAASVWIISTLVCWTPRGKSRPLKDTTPTVTLLPRPKGLPIAITHSPTSTWSESAISMTVRGSLGSIFSSATSVRASRPTSFAS